MKETFNVRQCYFGPRLGSCSGLKVSGYEACFKCGPDLHGRYSIHLKKTIYHEHRRRLPMDHPMRYDRRHWPRIEKEPCPSPLSLNDLEALTNAISREEISPQDAGIHRWSILFDLPYWKVLYT